MHYRGDVHDLCAAMASPRIGRRELLDDPPAASAARSGPSCTSTSEAPGSSTGSATSTSWSGRTARQRQVRTDRRGACFSRRSRSAGVGTCGSAPSRSTTLSSSLSPKPRTACSRLTRTPTTRSMSTFIVETHEDVWQRARTGRPVGRVARAGRESDLCKRRRSANALFAGALEGHPLIANNSKWLNFTTVRNARWQFGEHRAARRRRAHRPLLDRLRHQARDGGRGRAGLGAAVAPQRRSSTARSTAYED